MSAYKHQLPILAARIDAAINRIGLNLTGLNVLTEAATGPYLATAVVAAVAGAKHVTACTRDSRWGLADDIRHMTLALADLCGVADRINISSALAAESADGIDVVTNLGFVRPISRNLIRKLSPHASIALMWEPWEFREEDIDLLACQEYGVPIIGTNETHPNVATFKSVGLLALKLLLERHFEIIGLNVVIIGSNPFGQACADILDAVGAFTALFNPQASWPNESVEIALKSADAMVVVEHRHKGELLGPSTKAMVELLAKRQIPLVHICGSIDINYLSAFDVEKYPTNSVPSGFMTLTTAYVGFKPVIDLHTAGLHVASVVTRSRQRGANIDSALESAVATGYGLRLIAANKLLTRSSA